MRQVVVASIGLRGHEMVWGGSRRCLQYLHSLVLCFWFITSIISLQAKGCACLRFALPSLAEVCYSFFVRCDVLRRNSFRLSSKQKKTLHSFGYLVLSRSKPYKQLVCEILFMFVDFFPFFNRGLLLILCDITSCDATAFVGAQNRKTHFAALVTWCCLVHNPISNWYARACACLRFVFPSSAEVFLFIFYAILFFVMQQLSLELKTGKNTSQLWLLGAASFMTL